MHAYKCLFFLFELLAKEAAFQTCLRVRTHVRTLEPSCSWDTPLFGGAPIVVASLLTALLLADLPLLSLPSDTGAASRSSGGPVVQDTQAG